MDLSELNKRVDKGDSLYEMMKGLNRALETLHEVDSILYPHQEYLDTKYDTGKLLVAIKSSADTLFYNNRRNGAGIYVAYLKLKLKMWRKFDMKYEMNELIAQIKKIKRPQIIEGEETAGLEKSEKAQILKDIYSIPKVCRDWYSFFDELIQYYENLDERNSSQSNTSNSEL
ncbi:MAG: hypothetical protein MHMPM18_000237 [Marteilia pararefringens]